MVQPSRLHGSAMHQGEEASPANTRKSLPRLSQGDIVRLRGTTMWSLMVSVISMTASRSYRLRAEDGRMLRRNRRHVQTGEPYAETTSDDTAKESRPIASPQVLVAHSPAGSTSRTSGSTLGTCGTQQCTASTAGSSVPDASPSPAPRRSSRNARHPATPSL